MWFVYRTFTHPEQLLITATVSGFFHTLPELVQPLNFCAQVPHSTGLKGQLDLSN
jgi:hypothetical protein